MWRILTTIFFASLLTTNCLSASKLQPGYNAKEYMELLSFQLMQFHKQDSLYPDSLHYHNFKEVYKSPEMGLLNQWSLWIGADSVAVISIRGTIANSTSWLANFYAGMIPAKGQLILAPGDTFNYHFADDAKAAVHTGWTLATAYLIRDMLPHIDSCYKKGITNFIVSGHSQGGAIAFLVTACLYDYQKNNKVASDIRFKTYCSAAPKPGNLYFAYEYENMTRNGWAFNVVNSADWVPETPITIQTTTDINKTNPLVNAKAGIRKQKFPANLFIMHIFNRLQKTPYRAMRQYRKYLGGFAGKLVRKNLVNFQSPAYLNSSDYVRTGTTIVLLADKKYFDLFPDSKTKIFVHHFYEPYLYLAYKRQ